MDVLNTFETDPFHLTFLFGAEEHVIRDEVSVMQRVGKRWNGVNTQKVTNKQRWSVVMMQQSSVLSQFRANALKFRGITSNCLTGWHIFVMNHSSSIEERNLALSLTSWLSLVTIRRFLLIDLSIFWSPEISCLSVAPVFDRDHSTLQGLEFISRKLNQQVMRYLLYIRTENK